MASTCGGLVCGSKELRQDKLLFKKSKKGHVRAVPLLQFPTLALVNQIPSDDEAEALPAAAAWDTLNPTLLGESSPKVDEFLDSANAGHTLSGPQAVRVDTPTALAGHVPLIAKLLAELSC